ncbi:MAG: hypothetical protein GWP47_03635 [Actinobacteria bacterium]|nr:hypothetical protein [Actinomycetota bacterium]NCG39305.1 hypothetical protein [Actinomycetota bacterium]
MTELVVASTRAVPEKMMQSGVSFAVRAGCISGPVILLEGGCRVGHACSRAAR